MPPVAALIAGLSLSSILTSIAISFVGNFVIGAISQALGGTDQAAAGVQPQTITVKQPLMAWKVVYGRARVGGAWVYIHTTGNPTIGQNSALMGAIVLACHQCYAIDSIYFGDEEVKIDSTGNAVGKYRNYVHIWKHLGVPGQAADSQLIRWGDGTWSVNHRLDGMCYIAIDLAYNKDLFPSMPVISAVVRGRWVPDWRDSTWKYADNPVLALAEYLTNGPYGMAYPVSEFDIANWQAEANHCDELVQSAPVGGGVRFPQDAFQAEVSKTWKANAFTSKTLASAFTVNSDTLDLDTGDLVYLTGNALPPGVAANTPYYIIRISDGLDYVYQELNVKRTPVCQLATSRANATASPPVPLSITGNGSGTMWSVDDLWQLGPDLNGLQTGDYVQIYQADSNPLPAPLVLGGSYYWISRSHLNVYYENTHNLVAYGHGFLAWTEANARAGIAIALTQPGLGTYSVYKQYEKRFTLNGVVDTSAKPSDIIGKMLSSCGGKLVRAGGVWRIFTAVWRGVTYTLSDADLRGPIKVTTLVSRRDLFNAVRGTYISPSNSDQPSDFPPYPDPNRPDLDIFLAEDGERIWSQDIELPYTITPSMAQRLAKILLMQVRKQISLVFPAKLTAIGCTVGDVVQLSSTRMGWSNKTFEVVDWTFAIQNSGGSDGPELGIDITLRETDPAIFEWQNGAETTGWWSGRTNLPQVYQVPPPTLNSVVEELYVATPGAGRLSRAHLTWTAPMDGFTGYYQVGLWNAATPSTIGYQDLMDATTGTEALVQPLTPKQTYCFVVRAINVFNVSSPWSAAVCVALQGITTAPPDLTNFRVQAVAQKAHVTWDASPDQDVINGGYIELRWSSKTVGATWITATGLDLRLAGNATECTTMLKAGTYLAKAIDSAGNASVNAVAWVLLSVDTPGWANVITTNESPAFAGAKTNTVVSSGNLQLAITPGGGTVDLWASVDAVANWDSNGQVYPDGEYDYATVTDLGAVFGFRIDLNMDATQIGNSIFGDLASARIKAQIATTSDPPLTGTPTWSAWAPLLQGDFVARGIKRRLLFHTDDVHASVACTTLQDVISMFSATWTKQGQAIAATGTRVNFTPAFYQPPGACWGNVFTAGGGSPAPGDYVQVTGLDRQGATFTIRNSGGNAKAGTADLYAFGPGQQLA